MGQDAAKIRRPFLVSKQRRPFLSERAPLFGFSEPGRLLLPEPGLRAVGVGVVTAQVAAELLETGDLPCCRPADQGHALEHLPAAVVHPVGEGPLHHRLVPLVEELADIPPLHRAPAIPLGEPPGDLVRAVVLRAPALDVHRVRGEKVPDAGVPLGEPHVEPLADGRFPLFHLIAPFRCICSYL